MYKVTAFAFLQRPYEVKNSGGTEAPKNRSDVGSVVATCYLGCRMLMSIGNKVTRPDFALAAYFVLCFGAASWTLGHIDIFIED